MNGHKDCLQRCISGMPGAFSKAQISRQLKSMGLKKNKLTQAQVSFIKNKLNFASYQDAMAHSKLIMLPSGLSDGNVADRAFLVANFQAHRQLCSLHALAVSEVSTCLLLL